MLEKLHAFANRFRWLQPLGYVLGCISLVVAGYVAIYPAGGMEALFIPALLGFCWSLLAISLVSAFAMEPVQTEDGSGYFQRLRIRLQRAIKTLVALGFIALTLALVVVSFQLVRTGLG